MAGRSRQGEPWRLRSLPPESMRTRAALTACVTVLVAVGLSATILTGIAQARIGESLQERSREHVLDMSRALGVVIERADHRQIRDVIRMEMVDPRIAFIAIERLDGEIITTEVGDERIWRAYRGRAAKKSAAGEPLDRRSEDGPLERGRTLIGVYSKELVTSSSGSDRASAWVVIGYTDRAYLSLISQLRRVGAMTALAVAAAVAPMALLVAASLTRPIARVSRAAEQFARGESPETLPESGPIEIVSLSRSFNTMINKLSEAHLALLRVNRDLEEKVQERTNELQRVNRILETQIRDKNEFLRVVSHDLGAPLRNIAGMTALIIDTHGDKLPQDAIHRLERIAANVEIETNMLGDLLELSRTVTTPGRAHDVESVRIAREAAYVFEHALREHSIEMHIDEDLEIAHVDPGRLRTVFQNLIENAIKYMGDAEARRVSVGCERRDDRILFSVTDTGPGVPEQDRERIFQLFRRGGSASGVQGSGVGLAAVRAIVESWGGRIEVQPAPGGGSRFVFSAPAAIASWDDADEVREQSGSG